MLIEVFMNYKQINNSDRSFRREWRYEDGRIHRRDGPALAYYHPDGSIQQEWFYFNAKFLGTDNEGFWNLWERLTEEQRRATEILKCLARFS
jgi:hypothetical protein